MRVENTSKGQIHHTVGGTQAIFPSRKDGVNGAAEVSEAFVAAMMKDPIAASYFTGGDLVVVVVGAKSPEPVAVTASADVKAGEPVTVPPATVVEAKPKAKGQATK